MNWEYKFNEQALKDLKKLGKEGQKRILNYLEKNLSNCKNPRAIGKPLKGELGELWRYRTSNYRIICKIEDKELQILVIKAGHRKNIYE